MTKIALQTNVFGPRLDTDFRGVLGEIAAAGYAGIETNVRFLVGHTSAVARDLAEAGLVLVAGHVGLGQAVGEGREAYSPAVLAETLTSLGASMLLVSSGPPEGPDGWRALARNLVQVGRALRERGVRVLYHNHAAELQGRPHGLEILASETEAEDVGFAVDVAWVWRAGQDPAQVLRELGARVEYVHLKDSTSADWRELGRGQVPLEAALQVLRERDLPWWTVEQDESSLPPQEAARISRQWLRDRGW